MISELESLTTLFLHGLGVIRPCSLEVHAQPHEEFYEELQG